MAPELERSFARFETQREQFCDRLASYGHEYRIFKPAGSWSMLEVVDHLIKVEEAFASAVRSHLPGSRRMRLREHIGLGAVLLVMRSPLKVKTPPSAAQVLPSAAENWEALREKWARSRGALRTLLTDVTPPQSRLVLFKHPVSGGMTVGKGLHFLQRHQIHHTHQIERLRKAAAVGVGSVR